MSNITVEEVMKKYVDTRDLISEKKSAWDVELEPLLGFQKAREEWLTAKLDEAGVNSMAAKGVATAFFKKNEWVKVDDFQVFLREVVFAPLATKMAAAALEVTDGARGIKAEHFLDVFLDFFPFEYLVKNVTKEPILNLMGEVEVEKDESGRVVKEGRPNPPPAGISYGAKRVLQVNKK